MTYEVYRGEGANPDLAAEPYQVTGGLELALQCDFLIASEAIAAESGLGYRIFLVRRYLAMDVILTYVIWITLLAFLLDLALRQMSRKLFPWAGEDGI